MEPTLKDLLRQERTGHSYLIVGLFILATTLALFLIVFTRGQWHLGNPGFTEQTYCALAGGHEVSIGILHHCVAGA